MTYSNMLILFLETIGCLFVLVIFLWIVKLAFSIGENK